jgi:isocitrate dehydrogenase (NAD+)
MGPGEHNSWNIAMRQSLDIYASVVVCKSLPGLVTRHDNVDFAIIRENTEGEYSGLEHQSFPGVVESLKISTRYKAERIARFAFDFALKNGRKVRCGGSLLTRSSVGTDPSCISLEQKVTCIHKANIMKLGDGLFLNVCKEVAKEYESAGIKFENMIVDNT